MKDPKKEKLKNMMLEEVSIDPDLPALPRWMMLALFHNEDAELLARAFGTKEQRDLMKRLLGEKDKNEISGCDHSGD